MYQEKKSTVSSQSDGSQGDAKSDKVQTEFSDADFEAAVKKANGPLTELADKARAELKAGRGRKFPE